MIIAVTLQSCGMRGSLADPSLEVKCGYVCLRT